VKVVDCTIPAGLGFFFSVSKGLITTFLRGPGSSTGELAFVELVTGERTLMCLLKARALGDLSPRFSWLSSGDTLPVSAGSYAFGLNRMPSWSY
jgi:hypothetical protein